MIVEECLGAIEDDSRMNISGNELCKSLDSGYCTNENDLSLD